MNKNTYLVSVELVLPSELDNYFEITKFEPWENYLDVTFQELGLGFEGYDNGSLCVMVYNEALVSP